MINIVHLGKRLHSTDSKPTNIFIHSFQVTTSVGNDEINVRDEFIRLEQYQCPDQCTLEQLGMQFRYLSSLPNKRVYSVFVLPSSPCQPTNKYLIVRQTQQGLCGAGV
mgnify:CR=1 FL=1